MTAPAVVAWGAVLGWIDVDGKWSEWVGHPITVTVLTILLVVELVTDQLPKTPSRKTTAAVRRPALTGAFAGAVIGSAFFHTFSCDRRGHRRRGARHAWAAAEVAQQLVDGQRRTRPAGRVRSRTSSRCGGGFLVVVPGQPVV